ncbi:MAG: thymidylate synthase [Candidatus Kryptoniota bacterium]
MQKNIPVLTVSGKVLAEAYEKALIELYNKGIEFKTQYDKPGDPLSIDSTMNITILEPCADPMIHRAFPGGIDDLKEYVMELMGLKDHWIKNINDPTDTRWEYTYHGRLARYGTWQEVMEGKSTQSGFFCIDQTKYVIEKLAKQPYTRQAQMITWMPNLDLNCFDPPCLQSLWYRIIEDEDGVWWLNCNVRFRSNDAWGASFMNMFGFIQFNKKVIAAGLSEKTGKKVELGRMNWHADSYHIYGKDIANAKQSLFDRIDTLSFEERVFNFNDEFITEMYDGAEAGILEKMKQYDRDHE